MRLFLFSFMLFCALSSTGQNPLIVKTVSSTNLEPESDAQLNRRVKPWNGRIFYQGKGSSTACNLVVTDGTTAGTVFVKDLGNVGGINGVYPAQDFVYITTLKSEIVSFSPIVVNWTRQLWKSDGTPGGTELLKAFDPTTSTSNTGIFHSDALASVNYSIAGNLMYFNGYDAASGAELWKSDGTVAGTTRVKDIFPGTTGGAPFGFCKVGGTVCFFAQSPGIPYQLWQTDGTDAGTQILTRINQTAQSIAEFYSGLYKGKMYFWANDGITGAEVWYTDGTAAGTQLLGDFFPGNNATTGSGGMRTDLMFVQDNNYLYFPIERSKYVWRTDGTPTGTIQLNTTPLTSANIAGAIAKGNTLYWQDNVSTLYKSNGTAASTVVVKNNLLQATQLYSYKGAAWMNCRGYINNSDAEPWRSDGTAANTGRALDIFPGSVSGIYYSSDPFGYFELNGYLYFFASNLAGKHLFRYDGDMTFNNSLAGGRWRDSANWNSMMPPGITDTAFINPGLTVNVDGAKAYAGTLIMQNGAAVNLVATTDSLIINTELKGTTANGNGVVVLRQANGDTVRITNSLVGNNVTIDGHTSLNASLTVNNNLNLTANSRLVANNANVTLSGSVSNITAATNSYIVTNGTGVLRIENIGPSGRTGNVIYPIGTITNYNPVVFSNIGTIDVFSARVQPGISSVYSGETPTGGSYVGGAVNATWFINEGTPGGSSASIGLQWNAAQELPGFDRSQSRLGHYVGNAWQLNNPGAASGSNPYNWNGSGYNSFSPFGIFNSNATLPVHKINLQVIKTGRSNECRWAVMATDLQSVVLETSSDGQQFYLLHDANVTVSGIFSHSTINESKTYYRLRVTEASGFAKYSNVVWIDNSSTSVFQVYPTVFSNAFFVQTNKSEPALIRLYNSGGTLLLQKTIIQGVNNVVATNLAKGVYLYQISKDGVVFGSGHLIKQ